MSEAHEGAAACHIVVGHFSALCKGFFKVVFDIHDGVAVGKHASVFKVMVEAAVVHVDSSAGGNDVVGDGHLGVAEARCEFKDAHAVTGKSVVIGAGQAVDHFFVRAWLPETGHGSFHP